MKTRLISFLLVAGTLGLLQSPAEPPALQIVTSPHPETEGSEAGSGYSVPAQFSANGRFLLFYSSELDLVETPVPRDRVQVYLRDLDENRTILVSVNQDGTRGGDGHSTNARLTPDGRYVVFESEAGNLISREANGARQIFRRDLESATTILVSANQAGSGPGNAASQHPVMTADGRFVVFVSAAGDLTGDEENGRENVYLRDIEAGETRLISRIVPTDPEWTGRSFAPSISSDGRFIVFNSTVENVFGDVYLASLANQEITRISLHVAERTSSVHGIISDDGRFVAYQQQEVPRFDTSLILYNVSEETRELVSTNTVGADARSPTFVLSPDGSFLMYQAQGRIFLYNTQNRETTELTAPLAEAGGLMLADSPDLTADGRFAIFLSDSAAPVPDLIEPGAAKRFRLFLRDNLDGSLLALSMRQLRFPILSPDGQWIAFSATGGSSGAQPYHESANVYVFNRQTEAIQLASLRMGTPSATADSHSFLRAGRLSADGRRLLYRSFAGNLLPEAEGGRDNLLLQDLETGARQLLNVRADGLSSQGNIQHSFMTRNGRFIIFSSNAGDLVDLETGGVMNVYLFQVESGAIQLVSINLEGTGGGDHDSIFPEVSEDGRYVVFRSQSKNLVDTDPEEPPMVRRIFLRDTLEGTTRAAPFLISMHHPAFSRKISPDGRFVAFLRFDRVLHLWDVSQNEVIPLEAARDAVFFFFSPDSSGLFFEIPSTRFGPPQFFGRYDLFDRSYETICTNCAQLSVSDDGRFIVFQPLATEGDQEFDPVHSDVYLHDRELQTTRSLTESLRSDHPQVRFENAQISGNGRFVVFQSRPSNASFNGTLFRQVYWHDRLLGQTYLLSRNPENGQPGNHISLHPRINQDGTVVVFQSYASDLAPDDLNAASDLFAFKLGVLDSDGDGMDDAWEIAHFGDLSRDGTGDFDGDGMTDLEEFLAGTNPADDQSVLSVLTMEPAEGGYVTLLWSAVPGRTYLAQFKTNLDSSEWQGLQPLIQAEGFTASFTDLDASEASKRFYRVVLVP